MPHRSAWLRASIPGRVSLIPRYTRKEMGHVWSDANRFQKWLDVELAATETLAEAGQVPKELRPSSASALKSMSDTSTNSKRA